MIGPDPLETSRRITAQHYRALLDGQADELLAMVGSLTAQLAAAERLTDAIRGARDRGIVQAADANRPHAGIAAAAGMTTQGIGKITRAAGLSRYRPREPG
jgi:hypothetical protein